MGKSTTHPMDNPQIKYTAKANGHNVENLKEIPMGNRMGRPNAKGHGEVPRDNPWRLLWQSTGNPWDILGKSLRNPWEILGKSFLQILGKC